MGLCVSCFSSSSPSKMTNNRNNRADFSSTTETTNSNVGRPNQVLGAASDGSGQILESTNVKLYSFLDIKTATMNFNPDLMLRHGGIGQVYRGWIDAKTLAPSVAGSGMAVAIKRLNSENVHDLEDWQSVVNFLGRLSHPNLVKLLGHCREGKELLLVYEFMPKGSLSDHLFQRTEPFPWDLRIKIMIGAARGLAFLHGLQRTVIYREFNPSNILLDSNCEAKISDLEQAELGSFQANPHVAIRMMETYGYAAPEYLATGHLYVKSDVYGFGLVLLEIMTGLRVYDPKRPQGQESLVNWVRPKLSSKNKVKHIMDKAIEGQYSSKVATEMGRIIFSCTEADPKKRPHMKEVLDVLEHIQHINLVIPDPSSTKPDIASSSHI
ncbi:Serine-threonine/tyrosine-protein kinase [Hirschfeldia incana]|nr:Serine-threonine/tyrosine-protein kinase [Hirschfeldia incana]